MRVVVWNVQADQRTRERSRRIRARLAALDADLVCLNEAFPLDMANDSGGAHLVASGLSDWAAEAKGARKVILASRAGWTDADTEGSPLLPEGRFASGQLLWNGNKVRVLGIAPPYHAYRTTERWGTRRRRVWQGNEDYWQALAADVLPHVCAPAVILGDFNVQFPPQRYPPAHSRAFQLAEAALSGWKVATYGIAVDGSRLDKPLVCHAAHTPDLEASGIEVFSRFDDDGLELSDHPCVCLTLRPR